MNESVIRTISSEMNRYLNNYQMLLEFIMYIHINLEETLHYAMVNQNNVKISHRKYIC